MTSSETEGQETFIHITTKILVTPNKVYMLDGTCSVHFTSLSLHPVKLYCLCQFDCAVYKVLTTPTPHCVISIQYNSD